MKIGNTTIQDISSLTGGIVDKKHLSCVIDDISSLQDSVSSSLSFFTGAFFYLDELQATQAFACFTKEKYLAKIPHHIVPIIVKDPYLAIAQVINHYIGNGESVPKSFLSDSQKTGNISKFAVISSSAIIGQNVTIMPNVYIGDNVEIQDNTIIHSNVSLEHCMVGTNSIIRSGARIGTMGFGFVPNFTTGEHFLVPQIARVILGKNVDIGANTCIDRGFLTNTTIGDNTKIDNLVHIAHGVKIGKSCFIAACVGIAGSAIIGNFVMIGGQSSIAGHISLPDYTQVTAMSGVSKGPSEDGRIISGIPAIENNVWKKMQILALKSAKSSYK
jgi:UDP-3-O-[3-hydroxymyristoyl] glucosamine N-acyltransferase